MLSRFNTLHTIPLDPRLGKRAFYFDGSWRPAKIHRTARQGLVEFNSGVTS